eukprot:TRINITY_DN25057_c0_g1_i2.p1 TRINITY_DN25057_c0_g1~~TRINITY_DN25057_c0_g1_i2.p1  ORF type:complete len:166 (+),score=22.77 TRINITY_DN25057_c0_g1_i2:85-582(+)
MGDTSCIYQKRLEVEFVHEYFKSEKNALLIGLASGLPVLILVVFICWRVWKIHKFRYESLRDDYNAMLTKPVIAPHTYVYNPDIHKQPDEVKMDISDSPKKTVAEEEEKRRKVAVDTRHKGSLDEIEEEYATPLDYFGNELSREESIPRIGTGQVKHDDELKKAE